MTSLEQSVKIDTMNPVTKKNTKKDKSNLYVLSVLTRKVSLPYQYIGSNLKQLLQQKLSKELERKCTVEGYVRGNSVRVMTYSSGILKANNVVFDVVLECLLCTPVEGLVLNVKVANITKAGLRCESTSEESPIDVFVARDHHFTSKDFSEINEGDTITIRVLGQRYEINDPKISVIAELVKNTKRKVKKLAKKPLLVIE